MQFKNTFFTAVVAAALVSAAPAAEQLTNLVARADGSVTLCVDINFVNCTDVPFTRSVCQDLPIALQDDVSSVEVPQGFSCTLFQNGNCSPGGSVSISGNNPDLRVQQFNDEATSLRCA